MTPFAVVNADDLGLSTNVNDGIFDAFDAGLISDASLMAVGDAFDDAVTRLRARRRTGVGLHLCLVDGERPLAPRVDVLLEAGRFPERNRLFGRVLANRTAILVAMEREIEAQFARVEGEGLRITHVDSHQHAHLFPGIAALVVTACRRHHVSCVRAPRTAIRSHASLGVAVLSRRLRGQAHAAGVRPFTALGFEHSGTMTASALSGYVGRARAMGAEVMVHPGRGVSADYPKYAHWNYDWDREFRALRDAAADGSLGAVSYEQGLEQASRR